MKIYTQGLIAYETAKKLYLENKAKVEARFPKFFLQEFEKLPSDEAFESNFLANLCIEKKTKKPYSKKNYYFDGAVYAREILEGGVFAALWATCEDLKELLDVHKSFGCSVYLDQIPLNQHVVEILELLKENPYEVSSKGSYLIIPFDDVLNESPQAEGEYAKEVHLSEIGEITASNDRVIIWGENRRFLTPPLRQAKDIKDRRGEN